MCVCVCIYIYIYIFMYDDDDLLAIQWANSHYAFRSSTFFYSCSVSKSVSLLMISSQRVFWQPPYLFPLTMPSIISCSSEPVCITWLKNVRLSFVILLSYDISGLIRFRTSLLETLADHGILKSLLQHHNSKTSILSYPIYCI